MMRMLFAEQAQPFYSQADLVEIGPLSAAEVVDLVADGFAATDRSAGPLPGLIGRFAGGHPQRTMQMADAAWRLVPPGGAATEETWADALDTVRRSSADGNERLYSSLQPGEKAVLRALASGGSIFGAAAAVLDLATGTAQHAAQDAHRPRPPHPGRRLVQHRRPGLRRLDPQPLPDLTAARVASRDGGGWRRHTAIEVNNVGVARDR